VCAFRPGRVGGDYYDFLGTTARTGRPGPGDIAAREYLALCSWPTCRPTFAVTTRLLAALKEYFPLALDDFLTLAGILGDRLFYENSGNSDYATLFFGNYDDATRRLCYVNCGHPLRATARRCEQFIVEHLDSTSTVIGLSAAFECQVLEKQFAAGDILIMV